MKKLLSVCFFLLLIRTANAADKWWEIRLAGEPAGYQRTTTDNLENGNIRTTDEQFIVINRLNSRVEMRMKVESLENAAGELISVREETTSSQQTLVTESEVRGNEIEIRSIAGANSYRRSIPLRAPLCGPEHFNRLARAQLKKPGDSVTCRQYQPTTGPYSATLTVDGEEQFEAQKVFRASMTIAEMPPKIPVVLDRNGELVQMERDLPFGKMVVRVTDRETALRAAAGGNLPAESYVQTMARSNVRFADARAVERVRLKITHKKPEMGWPVMRGPSQTVVDKSPSVVILDVVRPEAESVQADVNEARFLKPNQVLQSDDAEVLRLAKEITGEERDRYKSVRKLQDWVANNLTFDAGIALASASEVVKNRRGTCLAYSVLLASMARAVDIPSRVALGYVYAAGIWGGHAWVEVLINGKWLPFDAAAYRAGIADAARFQFDSYTLEDNLMAGNLAGLQMYGNIDVSLLEYSVGGRKVEVPADVTAYSVNGNEYQNHGLGFSLRKPEGFTFSREDSVYPSRMILQTERESEKATVQLLEALSNPEAAIQKILDEIAPGAESHSTMLDGRNAIVVSSADKVRLVVREGQSLYVLTTEGADARGTLDRIAGGWKWVSLN